MQEVAISRLIRFGLEASSGLVDEFMAKHGLRTQRLTEVDRGIDETLDLAACTLAANGQVLLEIAHNDDMRLVRASLLCEELSELLAAMRDGDEVSALDALADLLYVLIGTASTFDLPLAPAFLEVHRSNMTKQVQEDREKGRVLVKGPDYSPPRLAELLKIYRRVSGDV